MSAAALANIDAVDDGSLLSDTDSLVHVSHHPVGIEQVPQHQQPADHLIKIVTSEDTKPQSATPPPLESGSRGGSMSTNAGEDDISAGQSQQQRQRQGRRLSDVTSVRSMPTVHITDAEQNSQVRRPSTAVTADDIHSPASSARSPPASASLRSSAAAQRNVSASERVNRHRSVTEGRSSGRLSGFLTNLIHRREGGGTPVPPSPSPVSSSHRRTTHGNRQQPSSSAQDGGDVTPASNDASRASSPSPPARPTTPPPSLPPPTLQELGLDLSVLTSELSPSHFSTPPISGAFLSPHYLLLCHAQGLDVLPLVSPPALQPYALVRRVSFKSVVIMELRGVLVAIAGRRDGVRVYALEEVKKAVEWRMEVEIRRERDRMKREAPKSGPVKAIMGSVDLGSTRDSAETSRKSSLNGHIAEGSEHGGSIDARKRANYRKSSLPPPISSNGATAVNNANPVLIPRNPTVKRAKAPSRGHPGSNSSASTPLPQQPEPADRPPSYSEATTASTSLSQVLRTSESSAHSPGLEPPAPYSKRESVVGVLTRAPSVLPNVNGTVAVSSGEQDDAKREWLEARDASDDEAIDVVAAGSSGSQALDERTSAVHNQTQQQHSISSPGTGGSSSLAAVSSSPTIVHSPTGSAGTLSSRRNRPANLDLSLSRANTTTTIAPQQPSPAPTLLSLRQALADNDPAGPSSTRQNNTSNDSNANDFDPDTPNWDAEEDDDDEGGLSLAEMLSESRLPELPPAGTRRPQQPIFIMSSHPVATGDDDMPPSPRTTSDMVHSRTGSHLAAAGTSSSSVNTPSIADSNSSIHTETLRSNRRRRRWSVFDGVLSGGSGSPSESSPALVQHQPQDQRSPSNPATPSPRGRDVSRSQSHRTPPRAASACGSVVADASATTPTRPPPLPPLIPPSAPPVPDTTNRATTPTSSHSRSRFIPRIISNAFTNRRTGTGDDGSAGGGASNGSSLAGQTIRSQTEGGTTIVEGGKRTGGMALAQAPPPKLEYVKLPGTKGALLVKTVETAKKSFLAILCGDNGEKVELFAGTYRTALGLSRTFILPDSPRSLELQLQGDDLVEVFLVFSQNVFGLEPATVRVREVRIGRAERRAARRRAREIRGDAPVTDNENGDREEDVNVNVSIGVSVTGSGPNPSADDGEEPSLIPAQHPGASTPIPEPQSSTANTYPEDILSPASHADEIVALATAQMGPYTTFQQLSFAPNFPLASIADEYIIPPTYPDFLEYRATHEPEPSGNGNTDLSQIQFCPPGLPVPVPSMPSKWYYRDPKGVVHGPWKVSLMQSWFKDGLLPLDLPVRREEDIDFMLLKDLRLQAVDPTHPFKPSPAPLNPQPLADIQNASKPLLNPLSLLSQPKHFGPPALFFSTRGGHSTAIVDARGRSVLKGRFVWSNDDGDDYSKHSLPGKMGDVKRLEAFDVEDRSVLVAMRQGGLEVVDLGDALLKPADESRTVLPQFAPPPSNINRRMPFVWRMGTPVASSSSAVPAMISHSSKIKSSHLLTKKASGAVRNQIGRTGDLSAGVFGEGGDSTDPRDEVLFLGRKNDELYLCERNAGSFRILRLSPNVSAATASS